MVAAVHYFANESDQDALLDYLGCPGETTLHPWPEVTSPQRELTRTEALRSRYVIVQSKTFGPAVVLRRGSPALEPKDRATLFNKLNWDATQPGEGAGIVDSNTSPVLFWKPGSLRPGEIAESSIGSQADSMHAVSDDYARWVNRTMSWVRRKGTKVWGLEIKAVRPDLDIQLVTASPVFALPGALSEIEAGSTGVGF